uniref:Chitinase n=1 Tax=Timema cristinae TaxID=61476 RepID=A0A7R9CFH4_TIMCR|nr:unnamed protein product [Timema cristinae]
MMWYSNPPFEISMSDMSPRNAMEPHASTRLYAPVKKKMWLVCWAVLIALAETSPRQLPFWGSQSFLRDSVERIPAHDTSLAEELHRSSNIKEYVFGSRTLPLREAVESIPVLARYSALTSSERLPLRDAVEKRPDWDLPEVNLGYSASHLAPVVEKPGLAWWKQKMASQQHSIKSAPSHYYGNKVAGSQKHKVVCFIEGWAVYRKEPMKFSTSKDLDPFACTHLIYAFATLDPHNFVISALVSFLRTCTGHSNHPPYCLDRPTVHFLPPTTTPLLPRLPPYTPRLSPSAGPRHRQFHEMVYTLCSGKAHRSKTLKSTSPVKQYSTRGSLSYHPDGHTQTLRHPHSTPTPLKFPTPELPSYSNLWLESLFSTKEDTPTLLESLRGYRSVLGMKRVNPSLKILISIGGWVEGTRKFSQMAGSAYNRREFIRSVLQFLDMYDFDGLDLDWEYPGAEDLGGRRTDKEHFSLLVEELSEVFAPRGWLLSASVSPSRFRLEDGYDVPRLNKHLDFINIMTFDLHAERDSAADHHSPLVQRKHDVGLNVFYNVVSTFLRLLVDRLYQGYPSFHAQLIVCVKDYAVRYWMKKGASREKIIVGIPFYGRSFSLVNASMSWPSAPVKGFGLEGKYTQEQGFLAYFEVLELLEDNHWRKETDDVGSPYIVKGDQWIGYDNTDSIATKMSYIRKNMLGGAMIWAIDLDDFHGLYGEKWPLLSVVKNALLVETKPEQLPGPILSPPVPVVLPPVAGSPVSVEKGVMNCTGQGFVRDSNDCAVYYRCEWSMKHTYICPEGLFYDSQLTLCNWPELTDCPFSAAIMEQTTLVPPVMVSTAGSVAVICQSNGMFEDSHDCRGYYVCQDGQPQRYTCSLGQSFNPYSGLCHYGTSPRCATQVKTRQYYEDEFIGGLPCSIICLRGLTLRRAASTCPIVSEEDYKVMCYFTNWAWYRKGEGKFVPEHLDPRLCTHIVYAYASLDPNDLVIKPFDPWADIDNNFYQRITGTGRPGAGAVNVLLALGGWTDSSGDKYSRLVSNGSARRKFVTSVVAYLRRHNFRGLQLDWTYPKCWQSNCGKGPSSDKPNFTKLVQASNS